MPDFMIVLILYINLLNVSWIKKCPIFEEYGAFKPYLDDGRLIINERLCAIKHRLNIVQSSVKNRSRSVMVAGTRANLSLCC